MTTDSGFNIDKAKWHSESEKFPKDVPDRHAYIHIGFFLGWLIERNLISDEFAELSSEEIQAFNRQELSAPGVLEVEITGTLGSEMLSEQGQEFAKAYYLSGLYFQDYVESLAKDLPSEYHVQDTWHNYLLAKDMIDNRFQQWLAGTLPAPKKIPWWRFWEKQRF